MEAFREAVSLSSSPISFVGDESCVNRGSFDPLSDLNIEINPKNFNQAPDEPWSAQVVAQVDQSLALEIKDTVSNPAKLYRGVPVGNRIIGSVYSAGEISPLPQGKDSLLIKPSSLSWFQAIRGKVLQIGEFQLVRK